MLQEGKFGYHGGISLVIITIVIRVFFTSPAALSQIVGNTGWYLTIISGLTAAFLFSFTYRLLKRFPGKDIMDINEIVLGKWLGPVITFIIALILITIASINLREFSEVLKIFVLPESPISFIMIIFVISVISLAFMGLGTLARYAKFMIYVLAAGFGLIVLLSISNFKTDHLFPLLGYGLDKTIIHGILRSSFYGEVALLGVIAKSLHGPRDIKRIGYSSLFISCLITSIAILAFALVFPYTTAKELVSPMYSMAALINLGDFLQRMEPIFLFLWNFGSFIEVGFIYYAALMMFCHVFRISDKRPMLMPLAILMYSIALIPQGLPEVEGKLVQTIRTWSWIIFFLPSIVVLMVAAFRKKKGETQNV